MKPDVAAAMIAAGLAVMGELPEGSPVPEPLKNPPRIKPSDYALLELEPASPQFVPVSASPASHRPDAPAAPPFPPEVKPARPRQPGKNHRRRQVADNSQKSPASRSLPAPQSPESSDLFPKRSLTRVPFPARQASLTLFPGEVDREPAKSPPSSTRPKRTRRP